MLYIDIKNRVNLNILQDIFKYCDKSRFTEQMQTDESCSSFNKKLI